jgi:N-acetylglucosaminyldiphosphoundecaprenol N-acetyl-beta-D-mannosaminyltransferase
MPNPWELTVNRQHLLGVMIDPVTIDDMHQVISEAIHNNERRIIANHNLHSIYLYHHNFQLRKFFAQAHTIHADGMALVFLGKLLGLPLRREHRTTYVDWVRPLMAEATHQNWRIFYLGSKPGVAKQGADILRREFPSLQIKTAPGYFNPEPDSLDNKAVLENINAYHPDILMVGMGMPRQELWIGDNLPAIPANAIITSGACMDYVAGAVPTPPRWMGQVGLEWLYRLLSEPKRLWRRYLLEPWFILWLFFSELLFQRMAGRKPSKIKNQ